MIPQAVAADIHRRLGIEVSPDLVMIVPGGKVTMFASILLFEVTSKARDFPKN